MNTIFIACLIGEAVCFYGWWVERKIAQNIGYKAACDISDRASCSKAFESPYSRLFGFSNVYKGMILYAIVGALAYFGYIATVFWIATATLVASLYLAYILFAIIQTFCPICIAVYMINVLLFILSALRYWR